MLKKTVINILLLLFLFSVVEFYCYNKIKQENYAVLQSHPQEKISDKPFTYIEKYSILKDFDTTFWNKSHIIENSDKKPILWTGCSFAEGAGLKEEQTPCHKIADLTGRSCINKSKGATGTQFLYHVLLNDELLNDVQSPGYVVYVYMSAHVYRLHAVQINFLNMFNLRYELENGNLKQIKINPLLKPFYSLYSVKRILNAKTFDKTTDEYKNYRLFNSLMKQSAKLVKQKYPGAEFIMIEFPDADSKLFLPDFEIKKLQSYGITTVRLTDIVKDVDVFDKKYWLSDKVHPSEALWDLFLPEFAEKYINKPE